MTLSNTIFKFFKKLKFNNNREWCLKHKSIFKLHELEVKVFGEEIKNRLNKFDNISWNESIKALHDPKNIGNYKDNFYRRLAYDEIFSTFLVNSEGKIIYKYLGPLTKEIITNEIKPLL